MSGVNYGPQPTPFQTLRLSKPLYRSYSAEHSAMEQQPDPVFSILNLEAEDVRKQFQKRLAFWTALTDDVTSDMNINSWKYLASDVPISTLSRIIQASLLSDANPLKREFRVRSVLLPIKCHFIESML